MKKIIYLLMILPFMAMLSGCEDNEEIIFDHEKPHFEIKENAILLEVIMPLGTVADADYYIVGPFNGGEEEAIGNLEWKLEKAAGSSIKWGIYLLPGSFQNGKTLADGFYFYSSNRGRELTALKEEVNHYLDVTVGTRTNVWVTRWELDADATRDHFRIYVDDQSGWDELALHYWGAIDGEGVTGTDWPGLRPAGTETINGVEYTYFELPKELNDKSINTIFNNNNNAKQFDAMFGLKVERDVYVRITDNSYELIDDPAYNGYYVYVDNQTTWEQLALYTWGDLEAPGGWPGLQPAGTKVINSVTYTYFQMGEDYNDKSVNLIFNNNNNGKQLGDIPVTIDRNFYFRITDTGGEEVDPNGTPYTGYTIYIDDKSGWEQLAIYGYYNDAPVTPGWPGLRQTDVKTINGVVYKYFEAGEDLNGKMMNLIFNGVVDQAPQFNGPEIKLDRDYYFEITAISATEVDPDNREPRMITLKLNVPEYTPENSDIRIYGNVNGWNGEDVTKWKAVMDENDPNIYYMELDMNNFSTSLTAEFKFGLMIEGKDWWYHQSNADGSENEIPGFALEQEPVEGETYALTIAGWCRSAEIPQ